MKRRILALLLGLCLLLPVGAGASQEICEYPTVEGLQELPKTVTRGAFLEALAASSGEDVADSAWRCML